MFVTRLYVFQRTDEALKLYNFTAQCMNNAYCTERLTLRTA